MILNEVSYIKLTRLTLAEATVPCFLDLAQSTIPTAGRGIFARHKLPIGVIFGPYEVKLCLFSMYMIIYNDLP